MARDCELLLKDERVCGVNAVGRCRRCERAMCESHRAIEVRYTGADSAVLPTGFCLDCQAENHTKALLAQRAETERNEQSWGAASLASIADPNEKLVIACRRFGGTYQSDGQVLFEVRHSNEYITVMKELFPTTYGRRKRPWDSGALARWFARRAHDSRIPTDCTASYSHWSKRIVGGYKKHVELVAAWRMPHDRGRGGDSFILTDGRFMPCEDNYPESVNRRRMIGDEEELGPIACIRMAELLGLR